MGGNFQQHQGVEFNNPDGTPVHAIGDGVVVFAGPAERGANTVAIRHDRRLKGLIIFSTYYHNAQLLVSVGQRVKAGDVIALVGNTGRATNDHLHLEIHVAPVDSVPLIVDPNERYPKYTVNPELWIRPLPGTGIVAGRGGGGPGPARSQGGFRVVAGGEMAGGMVGVGVRARAAWGGEDPGGGGGVEFPGGGGREGGGVRAAASPGSRLPPPGDAQTLQALLDLSGPGGYVVLLGSAAQHAVGLAGLMGGIHFVGVNAPDDVEELPVLSLLDCEAMIPLRQTVARAAVVGPDRLGAEWLAEARPGRPPGARAVSAEGGAEPPE